MFTVVIVWPPAVISARGEIGHCSDRKMSGQWAFCDEHQGLSDAGSEARAEERASA